MLALALALLVGAGAACTRAVDPAPPEGVAPDPGKARLPQLDEITRAGHPAWPRVSAHRGGPTRDQAENALSTLQATWRAAGGAPVMLEIDVRATRDGVLVLMHDDDVARTTDGTGHLGAMSHLRVQKLKLTSRTGRVLDEGVPTFDEVLTWAQARAYLAVDIKTDPLDVVVDHIAARDAFGYAQIIVYNLRDWAHVRHKYPAATVSVDVDGVRDVERLVAAADGHTAVFVGVGDVRADWVQALRAAGLPTIAGTFGDVDRAARGDAGHAYGGLLDRGVDCLATDTPRAAFAAILARSGRGVSAPAQ